MNTLRHTAGAIIAPGDQVAAARKLSTDALGEHILKEWRPLCEKLTALKPYVQVAFERMDAGEKVCGYSSKKEFCPNVLGRTYNAVKFMLGGGNPANKKLSAETDSNELAKQLSRIIEARITVIAGTHERLNPTIGLDLVRVLRSAVKKLTRPEKGWERTFKKAAASGKAHQRVVREHRATLPDPLFAEKQKLASDFRNAEVREITYEQAKPLILGCEYLGSMGNAALFYGLFFGPYLASVECFGSTAGTNVNAVCGKEHADQVITLVRGASEPWCDVPIVDSDGRKHANPSASYLIAEACKRLAARGKNIIVAYDDPDANEVGTIYQSANFIYTGRTSGGEKYRTPDGKVHDARWVSGQTRDRRNGELRYKRSRASQKRLLIKAGCKFFKGNGKHRYVFFAGDKATKRMLQKALKWKKVTRYPKREVLGNSRFDPLRPSLQEGLGRGSSKPRPTRFEDTHEHTT